MEGIGDGEATRFRARIPRAVRRARRLAFGFRGGTTAAAVAFLLLAVGFVVFLALSSLPEIRRSGLSFLTGAVWDPTTGVFGAGPAVVGTLLTSGLALLFAVPVGLGVAILSAEVAPRWLRGALAYIVELGAMVPSVVYGFWALVVLVPYLKAVVEPSLHRTLGPHLGFSGLPLGLDVLAASAILGVMAVPTVAALSREALLAVPRERREAALALGATRWEAARITVLGPAAPGIVGSVVLALGRAFGEAIAVVVVIGSTFGYPTSFLAPGTTLASWIVNSFPDAIGTQRYALFELGLVLFLVSMAVNVGARLALRRSAAGPAGPGPLRRWLGRRHRPPRSVRSPSGGSAAWWPRVVARRGRRIVERKVVAAVVVVLVVAALGIAIYPLFSVTRLAVENGGSVVLRPSFYTDALPPPCLHNCSLGGIGPAIQGTLLLVGLGSVIAVPVGLCTGIFLSEYARGRLRTGVGLVVDAFVGVPTILIGLFVFSAFVQVRPYLAQSAIAGGLALSVLMLPIVARSAEIALRTVPTSVRESALALGFPRHRVTTRVVLGGCRSALVTGMLLAVGRAAGETAALLFTVGWTQYGFSGWGQPISAMAPFIFQAFWTVGTPNWVRDAWGAALVLLVLMLGISLAARLSLRTSQVALAE